MKPLKITAHLRTGFSAQFDWSVSIDGILAYQFMLEKLGPDAFAETHALVEEQSPVEGLPLAVERWNGDWWYQCSRPVFTYFCVHTKKSTGALMRKKLSAMLETKQKSCRQQRGRSKTLDCRYLCLSQALSTGTHVETGLK